MTGSESVSVSMFGEMFKGITLHVMSPPDMLKTYVDD